MWHHHLGQINKKHITKFQSEGILESFDLKSDDVCEPCLLGKMTKSPFTGTCERGEDVLDLEHIDDVYCSDRPQGTMDTTTLHSLMISVDRIMSS